MVVVSPWNFQQGKNCVVKNFKHKHSFGMEWVIVANLSVLGASLKTWSSLLELVRRRGVGYNG